MKVLIVEDKKLLADAIQEYLKKDHKIDAITRYDGKEGYEEALRGVYDVMVLDLMLPSMDGLSIIKELRAKGIETPIIVLTAKSSTEDKVECLLAGADDYLTKPFVLEELLARLYVLTRRKGNIQPNELAYGNVTLDKLNHTLNHGEDKVTLSMKEYEIMELLMSNTEQIVDKKLILNKIWGKEEESYYNSAEVYISFLRKKLDALNTNVKIKSVRNVGYKLLIPDIDAPK